MQVKLFILNNRVIKDMCVLKVLSNSFSPLNNSSATDHNRGGLIHTTVG
jgi:hypothetical protein